MFKRSSVAIVSVLQLVLLACSDQAPDTNNPDLGRPDSSVGDTRPGDAGGTKDSSSINWTSEFDHVFAQGTVRPVNIKLSATDWASMLDDWRKQQKRTYRKAEVTFGADALKDVGVRLRGYGSLSQVQDKDLPAKFPLKLNFNKYGAPRYHHVDKVNLTVNRDDNSLMRDILTARLLSKMGVHAPRASLAKVTVSQVYAGIYTMTQQLDKTYLKERFGTKDSADDGNL